MGNRDKLYAEYIRRCCEEDVLFYFNTFLWTYDPRKEAPCRPFITYQYQDEGILQMIGALRGGYDIFCEKSRDMGMTVCIMSVADWDWRFHNDRSILCMSRKEGLVDRADDPDCLFAKLDYIEARLPSFLRALRTPAENRTCRTKLHLYNPITRSVIDGESTTGDAGRGGRRSWVFTDEFAFVPEAGKILNATGDVTKCRVFGSTPNGVNTAFYNLKLSDIETIRWHWSRHPEKSRGLYRVLKGGGTEVLDEAWHAKNPGYVFLSEPGGVDGLRSPWYDAECARRSSRVQVAQELDIDYAGAGDPYFPAELTQKHKILYGAMPLFTGTAKDLLGVDFGDKAGAPLRLWFHRDVLGKPPQSTTYTIAVDISTGTGASDSAVSVWRDDLREKVMEYESPHILPEDLAAFVVKLKEYFDTPKGEAFLIWDQGGPGKSFSKRIVEKYGILNVYYYRAEDDRKRPKMSKPGYPSNKQLKESLFNTYRSAMADGVIVNKSRKAVAQAECYVYDSGGGVSHSAALASEESSGSKENHGDMAYADALAVLALEQKPEPEEIIPEPPKNNGCLGFRLEHLHKKPNRGDELVVTEVA